MEFVTKPVDFALLKTQLQQFARQQVNQTVDHTLFWAVRAAGQAA
jgi:hypothetical protein